MYDELVKRLRICPDYNDGCVSCPHEHDLGCRSATMREAADAIEELQADKAALNGTVSNLFEQIKDLGKPRWIPVTERLPEKEKRTYWICTDTGYQCECRWTNNRFGIRESDEWGWSIFDITQYQEAVAWMPLPKPYEPPEEET